MCLIGAQWSRYLNTIISNIRSASQLKELVLKISLKKTNSSSTYAIIGAMATITLGVILIPDTVARCT